MTPDSRALEALRILKLYRGRASLNEIADANPKAFHTFRNGVASLRNFGAVIRYIHKTKEYIMEKEPTVFEGEQAVMGL